MKPPSATPQLDSILDPLMLSPVAKKNILERLYSFIILRQVCFLDVFSKYDPTAKETPCIQSNLSLNAIENDFELYLTGGNVPLTGQKMGENLKVGAAADIVSPAEFKVLALAFTRLISENPSWSNIAPRRHWCGGVPPAKQFMPPAKQFIYSIVDLDPLMDESSRVIYCDRELDLVSFCAGVDFFAKSQ